MILDRRRAWLPAAVLLVSLAGCESVPVLPGITPHKIDVQQGNVVTQEMVSKLTPGLTRQQVRFIMGTPPIVDPFRSDRWDYVYTYQRRGEIVEHRRLVLLFEGDSLKQVVGDVVPATDGGARGASSAGGRGAAPSGKPPAAASGAGTGAVAPAVPAASAPGIDPGPRPVAPPPGDPGPPGAGPLGVEPPAGPEAPVVKPAPAGERSFFGRMFERVGL